MKHQAKIDAIGDVVTNKDLDTAAAAKETARIILSEDEKPQEDIKRQGNENGNSITPQVNDSNIKEEEEVKENNLESVTTDNIISEALSEPVKPDETVEPSHPTTEAVAEIAINDDFVQNNPKLRKNMSIKLYGVSDSPPTLAVRMGLAHLDVPYQYKEIDFANAEQTKDEFTQKSPQGEVPLIEDDDFFLSESVAILQYIADKYKKDDSFYPCDPKKRAIVNHRLSFHLSTFYKAVANYMMLPLCYAYPRTETNLKFMNHALKVLEKILVKQGTKYMAGNDLTIADLPLVMGCVCLEAMGFDFSGYPTVLQWYMMFKSQHQKLWAVAETGLKELKQFEASPPDLSHVNHPLHPTDRTKM